MQGVIRGVSLRDLSASLGVGSKSISTYRSRLMTKLGVESNVELAALAARHGYT
jgi:DNA-binding CsgD family transcriptional regulator